MSDIAGLMRSANPVPDPASAITDDEFDALLLLTRARSTDMDVKELLAPVEPSQPTRRRWAVAVGAFVLVLLIGVAVALLQPSGNELPPAAPTETSVPTTAAPQEPQPTSAPAETVTSLSVGPIQLTPEQDGYVAQYLEARNSGDWDTYIASFAPGTKLQRSNDITPLWSNSPELDEKLHNLLWATGFHTEVSHCQQFPPRVVCTFLNTGTALEVFGIPSWAMVKTFEFDDAGLITYFKADMTQYPTAAWEQFTAWVQENHPDRRSLLAFSGREWNWDVDPADAMALIEDYRLYLESQ